MRSMPSTGRSIPRRPWLPWMGVLVTLAALLVVEATRHGPLGLPYPYPETLLVATLIAVAASGDSGGLKGGLASATLVTLYGVVFFETESASDPFDMPTTLSILLLGALSFGMALTTAGLKRRRDHLVADLERSRRGLAEKNEELERANRALLATNEGLEAFAYVVSHDLKEPVRAMNAYLEEAHEKAIREDVRTAVEKASEANERLARLLHGLLEVSRASRVDPNDLRAVDVLAATSGEACATRYGDLFRERSARLETLGLTGTPSAWATEEHVCQVLGNLLLNAVKHNDKTAPRVRVSAAPLDADATTVEVTVEDDGPGFDPRTVEDLGRVKPGRPSMVRGGFGLVIVRRAVERLGGRLWIDRSPELGGARVHFTLPATPGRPALQAPPAREPGRFSTRQT